MVHSGLPGSFNRNELTDLCVENLRDQDVEYISTLVDSMFSHIQVVIDSAGRYTKYRDAGVPYNNH